MKCSGCSATQTIQSTGIHSYTVTDILATCTSAGSNKCAYCSAKQSTLMLSHSFGGTVYTKAATCTSDGSTYIKCGKCSATQTQSTLKATGHNYKDDSIATCIATGSKKCDKCFAIVSTPATGVHSFTIKSEPETCTTKGKYDCATCTATQTIAATGHQFGGQAYTVGATCTAEGYTYVSCTKCKTEKYKYDIQPALNHNYDANYKSATCTETGLKKCIKCGITDTIPELKHTFKDEYTADASKHWKECRRCSEVTSSGAHVYNTELKCKECGYSSLIKATKVTLSSLPLELFVGGTYNISATVTPSNATYNTVTWSSSNTSIATVSAAGIITVKSSGKVTITATTKEGISGSVTVYVCKETLNMQIGDKLTFYDSPSVYQGFSVNYVEGAKDILKIYENNTITALDAGDVTILVEVGGAYYVRVKVRKQTKLSKEQVINLAGPAPMVLYPHTPNARTFTYNDIISDISVKSSLADHYRYNVMPFIKGMPLDVERSFEGVLNGPDERYAEWLWMMYGHMAPTQEELMHMLLSMAGMIPILGTAADIYNAYLYYIEGDAVNFLISAGVVIVSAVGDYLLIKDIASEVKFAFSSDARSKLALIPDSSVDAATKRAIIEYLDDVEGSINIVDPNKLIHIFDNVEHNFDEFLNFFNGDQVKAYLAIENAGQQYVTQNGITGIINASNQIMVNVSGFKVTIRGNVIDGILKIGTSFIE